MKKHLYSLLLLFVFLFLGDSPVRAQGWPANYNGVMLQAFYWDSFGATKWTTLEKQADELSKYFSLVWIPQSAKAASSPSMGYDPLYWFSDYNSSFGTKDELVTMIKTFKNKGIGTIADIVVNHRGNVSNWVDFPKETYKGVTYQLLSTDIVSDDDEGETKAWADKNGYSLSPNTEGTSEALGGKCEGWKGMRDLDHASTNVQNNVKAYLKMLLSDEFGYVGFRWDVAKGFPGKYFGIYNNDSKPTYSVGEFWDGDVSKCIKWIDATKYNNIIQSAIFDFPFRYTVRDAINNNDWEKLLNSSVISNADYRQYAVTFVENHDTEKRKNAEQDPIRKDTLAANAYLLAMPGTPCVFLTHWMAHKQEIKAMIDARKIAGITNTSTYSTMRHSKNYYANLIKVNDENRLIVIVGSDLDTYTPSSGQYTEILSGYHYKYYLANTLETAWVDKASGTYSGAQKVTLTAVSTDANAKLVYTTDGSNPTASSTSVASGTQIDIPADTEMTLKVGLLTGGTVKNIITREYSTKAPAEEPFTIPSCCTRNETEICAFFEAPATWTNTISCWAWTNSPEDNFTYANKGWPGVKCEKVGTADNGNTVWKWTWDGTKQNNSSATQPTGIIFSNTGSPQTDDFEFVNGGYYQKEGLKGTVTTTGIRDLTAPSYENEKIYTIDGRVVRDHYDLNTLPHGIYIYKGKKIVK